MINYDYNTSQVILMKYFVLLICFIMTCTLYTSPETSTCKYCLAGKTNQQTGLRKI